NMPLWHERDISHSSVERVIMPDSTILADYILHRLAGLLKNLRVIPENMARNLDSSFGLFYSQRVLVGLLDTGLPRQKAYELVQAAAMRSWDQRRPFKGEVLADVEIRKNLSLETLERLFDPCYYLRHVSTVYARVFG
ncbi:MAG: adenylosuccinate lyase, partial [Humidesulfovibrio sp.]|nr:adenylosuccinate lyase [Humidesulfovibrio sp.]